MGTRQELRAVRRVLLCCPMPVPVYLRLYHQGIHISCLPFTREFLRWYQQDSPGAELLGGFWLVNHPGMDTG